MKGKFFLIILFLALACPAVTSSAQAAPTDIFIGTQLSPSGGTLIPDGTPASLLSAGLNSSTALTLFPPANGGQLHYDIYGALSAQTEIAFSYDMSGSFSGTGNLGLNAYLDDFLYSGEKAEISTMPGSSASATSSLIYASAQFDANSTAGKIVIGNLSDDILYFTSSLIQTFNGGQNANLSVQYDVSAVPLPGALPMFALGFAALIGLKRQRKEHAAIKNSGLHPVL
ncbi:MAG: hypothetical protein ACLFU1_08220 [Alphaproteobacteria bacterium]